MMRTKVRQFLAIGAISAAALTSQTPLQTQRCGSGDRYICLISSAEFRTQMESLEDASRSEYGLLNVEGLGQLKQVTIPVLVHVIYTGDKSPVNGYITKSQ